MIYTQALQGRSYGFEDLGTLLARLRRGGRRTNWPGSPRPRRRNGPSPQWRLTDLPVATFLSDDIGSFLTARVAVIIVGGRPGLSAADSLGIYLTYAPRPGNTDTQRNCISNIRPPEGLGCETVATKLLYLTEAALRRGPSGVALKDEMPVLRDATTLNIPGNRET